MLKFISLVYVNTARHSFYASSSAIKFRLQFLEINATKTAGQSSRLDSHFESSPRHKVRSRGRDSGESKTTRLLFRQPESNFRSASRSTAQSYFAQSTYVCTWQADYEFS